MRNSDEFYSKLKDSLNATTVFPTDYLYKFIVQGNQEKVNEVVRIFKDTNAKFTQTPSKTGKYISVSISVRLSSANEVIGYYKKASSIEGIISL